jgi:predicted nucleic acid-binding protein
MTCEAVIAESCYLVREIDGAAEDILANVANGTIHIPFQLSACAPEVQSIFRKYRDTPADFADACLIAMADQLDTGDILTLDSDFKHYRWRRSRRFRLLIPLE